MHTNYRESHMNKGRHYHDKFVYGPYRSVIWGIEQAQVLEIQSRYRAKQDSSIGLLDFACGTGRILQLLAGHVDSAVGVDVSKSMLEVAETNFLKDDGPGEDRPKVDLLNVDLTRDPALEGRRFEMITSFRFFPNAEPKLRDDAMRVLSGLLAADGIMILNNHLRCSGTKMRLRRFRHRVGRKGKERDLHCMSDAEVEQLAARFELSILEIHPLAFVPILREKRPWLPKRMISWIERWSLGRPWLDGFANMRIYVLGHKARADSSVGQTLPAQ